MIPAVTGPLLVRRQGGPPAFELLDEPSRFVGLEVAARPELLAGAAAGGRSPAEYWASWEAGGGGLLPPGRLSLPKDAWVRLRGHERLFYRAHASAAAATWTDHAASLPDDAVRAAPQLRLCDGWVMPGELVGEVEAARALEAAAAHPAFAAFDRGGRLEALVGLHRFSPRRPADPRMLEWLVVLRADVPAARRVLAMRLSYDGFRPLAASLTERATEAPAGGAAARPGAAAQALALALATARAWPSVSFGPFTVHRELAPAPDDDGGTCVLLDDDDCAYLASTRWSGAPEVLLPR